MILQSYSNLKRAGNLIINAKKASLLPDNDTELKSIMKFGAGFRYTQSKILAAFSIGILIFLFGFLSSFNGIIQKDHPPMDTDGFAEVDDITGYIDLEAYIGGSDSGKGLQVSAEIDDMELQLFPVTDESFPRDKRVIAVLGMTRGHLNRFKRDNKGFDSSLPLNAVRIQGLIREPLNDNYATYFRNEGLVLDNETPLIIAYQFKSTEIQSFLIFCVLSFMLLAFAAVMQIGMNKKYLSQLSDHERYIERLLKRII